MKKFVLIILFLTSTKVSESKIPIIYRDLLPEVVVKMDRPKYLQDFLNAMGHRESSNRYHVVNSLGYMGKYQFGMSTLKTLRIHTTKENFLNTPWLQEHAMKKLLKRNKELLSVIIDEYSGSVVGNTYVTESGILAAAHLGGAGSVMEFFIDGTDKHDAYGTKVSNYMTDFGGYNLRLN